MHQLAIAACITKEASMNGNIVLQGIIILILVLLLKDRVPYIGNLPGDLSFRFGNVQLFIPFMSCLLVSLGISLLRGIFSGR
jgi:hypothetical protein